MKFAVWTLRNTASFKNQSDLLYRAAVRLGYEAEIRDIMDAADLKKDRWDRAIMLAPFWPRYIFDAVRLSAPILSRHFTFYGPVDGPFTMNLQFFEVCKNLEIVTTSAWCMEQILKSGVQVKGYCYHGIDPQDFKFDESQRQAIVKPLRDRFGQAYLFFANLNPIHRKGFNHLARALELLSKERPEGWVFLLHTGRDKALQLEAGLAKIQQLVIQDSYNGLPFRQVALQTAACDCFVCPSLLEGFGSHLEAAAAARPIICQDMAPLNEIVNPGCAFMFPGSGLKVERWPQPGCLAQLHTYEPVVLKDMMIYVMDHREEAKEKAHKALKRSEAFNYLQVYKPLIKGKF